MLELIPDGLQQSCRKHYSDEIIIKKIQDGWDMKLENPNAVSLDTCCFSTDSGNTWEKARLVTDVSDILSRRRYEGIVCFKFEFFVQHDYCGKLKAAVEEIDEYIMEINGSKASCTAEDWFIDKSIKVTDISGYIVPGRNVYQHIVSFFDGARGAIDVPIKPLNTFKVEIKKKDNGQYAYMVNGQELALVHAIGTEMDEVFADGKAYFMMGSSTNNGEATEFTINKINGGPAADKNPANPETGDKNLVLFIVLLIIAGIALYVLRARKAKLA